MDVIFLQRVLCDIPTRQVHPASSSTGSSQHLDLTVYAPIMQRLILKRLVNPPPIATIFWNGSQIYHVNSPHIFNETAPKLQPSNPSCVSTDRLHHGSVHCTYYCIEQPNLQISEPGT